MDEMFDHWVNAWVFTSHPALIHFPLSAHYWLIIFRYSTTFFNFFELNLKLFVFFIYFGFLELFVCFFFLVEIELFMLTI